MTSPKALKVHSISELDARVDSLIIITPSLDLLPVEYSEEIKQLNSKNAIR